MTPLLTQDFLREHGLAALCERFNIKAARHEAHPNLIQLKYNQITAPMAEPIVQQCRGLIVDESRDWEAVCHPFDKFFNANEPLAAPIDWASARVFEKLDGSLMSLYFYGGAWQVASSGRPEAGGPMGSRPGYTMAQGFWETWRDLKYTTPGPEFAGWWFGFEFMTPWNQVIVRHAAPRIVLTGARGPDGREVWPGDARETNGFNWEVVQSFAMGNLEEALAAAEKIPALSGEGFVVCDADFARVKIKSTQYVALHHLRTSFSLRRMIDVARSNEGAEFLAYFPDFAPQYEDVRARYEGVIARCEADYERIRGAQSQRDFAEAAKACEVPAALFALRNGKASSARDFFERALISPLIGWLGLREAAAREEEAAVE
jgi:hypothetical protein